ncbi:Saccharopine dehydrogenase NADP binding domain [Rhizoctonia solani]|uniref:Saccharopine dehydrogenase NADP binding domain n=1 Tax=Rhizoctonia solani TaxID=456999 RepID=A0A8H7I8T7_9AGAM|nr:Saccharopine dehydrogenase NADP binding domain [Rhizoctonia solani]
MASKTIALVGANGLVGKSFANSFLDQGLDLRILARVESTESAVLKELTSRGASVRGISYEDESSLIKALQGVDVLVSTVSAAGLTTQLVLIKAANIAGVKLFFPSEYGNVYDHPSNEISPYLQLKKTIVNSAKELGLPYAGRCVGRRECKTHMDNYTFDANSWIANVLKSVSIEQLQNKHLRIQGDSASANEIVKLWKRNTTKLEVVYHPTTELDERLSADKNDILAIILREWASGRGEIGGKDNGLYPSWKPDTVESVL